MSLHTHLAALTAGDDAVAEEAVPALAALGPEAVPPLLELFKSDHGDDRWWALRALAEFDDERAKTALVHALGDADPAVRQCAALGLSQRPAPHALDPLLNLLGSKDRLLARLAGEALTVLGSRAVPGLAQAAKDPSVQVRIEAVRSLAQLRHPDAIGPLFQAVDDPSGLVAYWAEEGLTRLGIGMVFFHP